MFDKLLLAVDGSDRSVRATEAAGELAAKLGADLVILTVDDARPLPEPLQALAESEDLSRQQLFETILGSARSRARQAGARVAEMRIGDGEPAKAIVKTADEVNADLIVMGSHGFGPVGEIMMGSVSHDVMRHTGLPCLVTR